MNAYVDPKDFIITRKRKKYKFAKFANSALCYEFDEWQKSPADVVEVGAGTGLFSVELASLHPDKRYVAIDVKGDRLQTGAYEAQRRGLENVFFVRARADQVEELFVPDSVEQVWVTFADPYPKKRSSGRRMTHATFLKRYGVVLSPTGSLYIKHDNQAFFTWTLEQLVANSWVLKELSFDLHESELLEEYKIQTTYEQRWLGEGRTTQFVRAAVVSSDQ